MNPAANPDSIAALPHSIHPAHVSSQRRSPHATRGHRLLPSFFAGGFECSTHSLRNGKRLDMVAATRHEEFADADYARLRSAGIAVSREGLRWHLIERRRGEFDFSGALPIVKAAHRNRVQPIWDLMHFGWPEDLDIFQPEFVDRFAALAKAFATLLKNESDAPLMIAPVNEISFLSWVGGEAGDVNPFVKGRGFELKCQLVRASIAAIEAVWDVDSTARIFHNEPMFNVAPAPERPEDAEAAEAYRQLQFQAFDLLAGRIWPQLGGQERYLDVIGANYYPWNQWLYNGPLHAGRQLATDDPLYRPLSNLLCEWHERYRKPLWIAETGCENERRPAWLRFISDETQRAMQRGVAMNGICLYPIVNFPGWDNDRHCHNGLWDYADDAGQRDIYEPLAAEIERQQKLFDAATAARPEIGVFALHPPAHARAQLEAGADTGPRQAAPNDRAAFARTGTGP